MIQIPTTFKEWREHYLLLRHYGIEKGWILTRTPGSRPSPKGPPKRTKKDPPKLLSEGQKRNILHGPPDPCV